MRFQNSLDRKFQHIHHHHHDTDIKKTPVSGTLKIFLESESQRIEQLIQKKNQWAEKLREIEKASLTYRDTLRTKINEQQAKHSKNREAFLEKRVKGEKFKIKEVDRRRTAHLEKMKEKRKTNEDRFRKNKSETVDFWRHKHESILKSYRTLTAVAPEFQDAVTRKKQMEKRSQEFSETTRDKFLVQHELVNERIESIWLRKKARLQKHSETMDRNYLHSQFILENREHKFVNDICFQRSRSEILQRKTEADWQKKLKGRLIDQRDNIQKKKENLASHIMKRTQTIKSCRCHNRSRDQQPMTKSISLNEEDIQGTDRKNLSIKETRQGFMLQSQMNFSGVQVNKNNLREKQDSLHEKKLMVEKEISEALQTRDQIKDESNLMVRHARVLA